MHSRDKHTGREGGYLVRSAGGAAFLAHVHNGFGRGEHLDSRGYRESFLKYFFHGLGDLFSSGLFSLALFFPRVFFPGSFSPGVRPRPRPRPRPCVSAPGSRKSSTSHNLHINSRGLHIVNFTGSSQYLSKILPNLETARRAKKKKGVYERCVN